MNGKLKYLFSQLQSYKTNRKIVVIESDDWGSERIPNIGVQGQLIKEGVEMFKNSFTRYDTLEREEDLLELNDILDSVASSYGKHIKITANFIMANPEYFKIKASSFEHYFFEHFTATYKNRDGDEKTLNALNSLFCKGYLYPQFHGREHINIAFWLDELRMGNPYFRKAFDLNCFGIDAPTVGKHRANLMAAYEYDNEIQKHFVLDSIAEGMKMFEQQFGFPSQTVVAPRHVWNDEIEYVYQKVGATGIQSALNQLVPITNGYKHRVHFTGKHNKNTKLSYLVRTAYFEPSYNQKYDWVGQTIKKIDWAFMLKNPVVLAMHRVNFVGGLYEENRKRTLQLFKELLKQIIKKHPTVEFLTSDELIQIIQKDNVRN